MEIQQDTIDAIIEAANDAFFSVMAWDVKTPKERSNRETAFLSITEVRKQLEAAGLDHTTYLKKQEEMDHA